MSDVFSGLGRIEIYTNPSVDADKIRIRCRASCDFECFTEGPSMGVFTPFAHEGSIPPLWVIEIPENAIHDLPETEGHSLHSWAVHVAASLLYGLFVVTPNDHETFLTRVHASVCRLDSDVVHQSWAELFMNKVQMEVDDSFER